MSAERAKIGVALGPWAEQFMVALRNHEGFGWEFDAELFDIDRSDWIERCAPFDLIVWRSNYMGPEFSSYFKEKVFFMEHYLGKQVVPSYATIWHFDSKIAQSYLFRDAAIRAPRTFVSFSREEAELEAVTATYPLVAKRSYGASSDSVGLLPDSRHAATQVRRRFWLDSWLDHKARHASRVGRVLTGLPHEWFWLRVKHRLLFGAWTWGVVYWQEFMPGNDRDLRVTVIGDRDAVAFWRGNRPDDFRASGSGRLDYDRAVPEEVIRYCVSLNRDFGFDSMAYDILFRGQDFVVVEMSYAYVDHAVHAAPGHYELTDDDRVLYRLGRSWPQELWVNWAVRRALAWARIAGRDGDNTKATEDTPR